MAQIKVGIKVENADPRMRGGLAQMIGQAAKAGKGDFMAATQPQRQMPLVEQITDVVSVNLLRAFEIAVGAAHVACVIQRRMAVPR
ncbi:hypothetical protein D3C73_1458990 [compost metagenome]